MRYLRGTPAPAPDLWNIQRNVVSKDFPNIMGAMATVGDALLSRLPADYCQLEVAFDLPRTRTELVWKSDISFGDKALGLKATLSGVIHYCQLGKLNIDCK